MVGFPSASQPDYDFVRWLIDGDRIPDDVTIAALTQSRDHLIDRTFESLEGVNKAIIHLYNSTSTVQRERVFEMDEDGIIDIAVEGAQRVKENAVKRPRVHWRLEYSPESFSTTEPEFAVRICEAVMDVWQPTRRPDHLQPAEHGRDGRPAPPRRPDRVFLPEREEPRVGDRVRAHAQRPRRRGGRGRAGDAGRRRARGRHAAGQRRAHRQHGYRDPGDESLRPGHRSGAGSVQPGRDHPRGARVHRHSAASAPSLGGRAGLYRVFRQPPGCDPQVAAQAGRG